ncbi:MAG: hypothetical protein ACP5IC_02230 [Minisyncoccia bacterium]
MFGFIFEILFFLSLSTIIVIIAHALPRLSDTDLKTYDHFKINMYIEKIDKWLEHQYEIWLRYFRVMLLKLDNSISQKLNKFKKEETKSFLPPDEKNQQKEDIENLNK